MVEFEITAAFGCQMVCRLAADNSKPLVIMFGWFKSDVKQLSAFATIHERQGRSVVLFTAPPDAVMDRENEQVFGASVAELLTTDDRFWPWFSDASTGKRNVVFHVFSNGGMTAIRGLFDRKGQRPPAVQTLGRSVAGMIIDSAPARITLGMMQIVAKLSRGFSVEDCDRLMKGYPPEDFWAAMESFEVDQERYVPELFIYSSADTITDADALQALIESRRRRRPDGSVKSIRFSDSEHVRHFVARRHEYVRAVEEHIGSCMC